ncbi:uncharacterized protein LOC135378684 isoform X2 [Ornithodoros turicata]|uniref:uncharacterized protein LOC135378684 isoform X2 n=1 Tax=Ornithodoros turicata TaxID=34597 RepID=UPI003138BAB2
MTSLLFLVTIIRSVVADIPFLDAGNETAKHLASFALNHTTEFIGPWVALTKYIVYVLTKQPIDAAIFRVYQHPDARATPISLLNQIRLNQPFVYQGFETMLVVANVLLVAFLALFILRMMHTCGASREQDVTINYRLLLQTYIVSAWIIMGIAILMAVIVLSCDYNLEGGLNGLEIYMSSLKGRINNFLEKDMLQGAELTYQLMSKALQVHHDYFSEAGFGQASRVTVVLDLRKHLAAETLFSINYTNAVDDLLDNVTTYPAPIAEIVSNISAEARVIDLNSYDITRTVIGSLSDSTLFQRYGLIITVTDLIEKIKGQLFSYNHEIDLVLEGVKSIHSILLDDPDTLFYLPALQKFLSKSITVNMCFVVMTIGGMMTGAMLGYANHNDYESPLERNALSNTAGKMLVIVSFVMLGGIIVMVLFISIVFLVGCLGEIFVCRPQRDRVVGDNADLLNFATSLLMDATVNAYHVRKLLRLSNIRQHCQSHLGISRLAGIHSEELEKAIDRIDDMQRDLVDHYTLNLEAAIDTIQQRGTSLYNIRALLEKFESFTKDPDDTQKISVIKGIINDDMLLVNFSREPGFKQYVQTSFLEATLAKCDQLKSDVLTFLDRFDRVGNCTKINTVFETAFTIMCTGFIDYLNGYWSALLVLTGLFGYAIYVCLCTSKYLITMKSYTYEGEPVPEGVKFDELATHRKQKTRKRRMEHIVKPEGEIPGAEEEEQKKMRELADKMKQLRLKKKERIEAEEDQGQVGIANIAGMAGAAGMAGITGVAGVAGMAAAGIGNILPVSMFLGGRKQKTDSESEDESEDNLDPEFRS